MRNNKKGENRFFIFDKKSENRFFVKNKKGGSGFFIKNKKGLELAVNTLIVIILAILVLIAVLVVFDRQTGIFSDFIGNLIGKTNIDSLVASCNSLSSQEASYDFCCVGKKARYKSEGKIIEEEITCQELSDKSFGSGINKLNCEGVC